MKRFVREVMWIFGDDSEARQMRESLYAFLIVLGWGILWVELAQTWHPAWWQQLLGVGIFAFIPCSLLVYLLRDAERERQKKAQDALGARNTFHRMQLNLATSRLSQATPADFETTQNAASSCIAVVGYLERSDKAWTLGFDSLDLFYTAYEARHPDIRLYSAVWEEIATDDRDPNDPPNGTGAVIAERIAAHRVQPG